MLHVITTPRNRENMIKDQFVPATEEEFYKALKEPLDILQSYGFGIWDSLSSVVEENITGAGEVKYISFPSFNIDGSPAGETTIKVGAHNRPLEYRQDKWIILFPVEWFEAIPDGFNVVGLYGQQYGFDKLTTPREGRFGCLGCGILFNKEENL